MMIVMNLPFCNSFWIFVSGLGSPFLGGGVGTILVLIYLAKTAVSATFFAFCNNALASPFLGGGVGPIGERSIIGERRLGTFARHMLVWDLAYTKVGDFDILQIPVVWGEDMSPFATFSLQNWQRGKFPCLWTAANPAQFSHSDVTWK